MTFWETQSLWHVCPTWGIALCLRRLDIHFSVRRGLGRVAGIVVISIVAIVIASATTFSWACFFLLWFV